VVGPSASGSIWGRATRVVLAWVIFMMAHFLLGKNANIAHSVPGGGQGFKA
jgi:hypothetical protein